MEAVLPDTDETRDRLPNWGDGVDTPSEPVLLASRSRRQLQPVVTGEGDRAMARAMHGREQSTPVRAEKRTRRSVVSRQQ